MCSRDGQVRPERVTLHLTRKGDATPNQQTFDMTFYDVNGSARLYMRDFTLVTKDRLFDISLQPSP